MHRSDYQEVLIIEGDCPEALILMGENGVANGILTHDNRNHNPVVGMGFSWINVY